jgi:hypothetical protein
MDKPALDDPPVNIKLRLAGLWTSLMFCYIYGDYFGLFVHGTLSDMIAGNMGPLGPASDGVLLGVSAMMAAPSLMVFASLALRAGINRWLNVAMGLAYTAIMLLTMPGARPFYMFLGVIEVLLSAAVVWLAWRWPRS